MATKKSHGQRKTYRKKLKNQNQKERALLNDSRTSCERRVRNRKAKIKNHHNRRSRKNRSPISEGLDMVIVDVDKSRIY